jgi:SNF2 family DNA or RNA helicase
VKFRQKGYVESLLTGPSRPDQINLKQTKDLKDILSSYVDTYNLKDDPEAKNHFPSKSEVTITTPMSVEQDRMYKYLEGNIPLLIRMKIRHNLPLDKKESAALNAFSTGVRQASNSISPYTKSGTAEITPKLYRAVDELKTLSETTPNFRAVVYSNYLKAGLEDYSNTLAENGIEHTLYHGGLSKKDKDKAVVDYNTGRVPVLLISSSGAEGLDLKGTKLIQVLEPHFNNSKIQQVTGRGIRYKSHEHLPKEERHVVVQHFLSTFRPNMFGSIPGKTIDQYLKENSLGKDIVVDKINELLKTARVNNARKIITSRRAEKVIGHVADVKDAHDTYKSTKSKYKKMKKDFKYG